MSNSTLATKGATSRFPGIVQNSKGSPETTKDRTKEILVFRGVIGEFRGFVVADDIRDDVGT
jgi:hypothetical protein